MFEIELTASADDDFDREMELTRENQELMDFLDERSQDTTTFTLAQSDNILG